MAKNRLILSIMRRFENHEVYFLHWSLGVLAPYREPIESFDYDKWLTGAVNIDLTFTKTANFSSFLEATSIAVPRSRSAF